MPKRVLIIGGYGNFGGYIARRLAPDPNIKLVIAGRSGAKATHAARRLEAANPAEGAALDITDGLEAALQAIKPDIVIHTSGPFQGQGYGVAEACIRAGSHYIDLADGREFVAGIGALDAAAKAAGVSVISGASSVPCLSSAIVDAYAPRFGALTALDYGITTAQETNRGLATTEAILSYAGKPFPRLESGRMRNVYGWQGLHARDFSGLGSRYMGNCNIPDLALFPDRYPTLKTQRFYAGQELAVLHMGLWALTWLVRARLVRSLKPWARTLMKISFLFDSMGSDTSAFYMRLKGSGTDGQPHEVRFNLTARSGDGPNIPCMPAILLAGKLAAGAPVPKGAAPCVGYITLEEYLRALAPLDISWTVTET